MGRQYGLAIDGQLYCSKERCRFQAPGDLLVRKTLGSDERHLMRRPIANGLRDAIRFPVRHVMPEEKPLPNLLVIHGAFALNPDMRHRGSLELKDDTPGGDMLIPRGSGPHEAVERKV
jgi:hypothetical protein